MRIFVLLTLVVLVSACSNGHVSHDTSILSNRTIANTEKVFAGIPILLGMDGSAARLNEEWMVTAAHNMPILVATGRWDVIEHPTCDIAVYRSKGSNTVPLAIGHFGEELVAVGYPMGMPMAANPGKVIGNVVMDDYPDCTMVATTMVIAQGMSGGGVYNTDGELVGVVHGFATSTMYWPDGTSLSNGGVYVQLSTVREWLFEVTGVKL